MQRVLVFHYTVSNDSAIMAFVLKKISFRFEKKLDSQIFAATDYEHSVEDYQIDVSFQQKWIHRCTAMIQTTLDGAAPNVFQSCL